MVDDEDETRDLVKFLLSQCEADVTTAGSAAAAFDAIATRPFDLMISDVGMPGKTGIRSFVAFASSLRRSTVRIPALALTAYARGEDRTRALKAGFNMHIAKPIDPNELLVVCATLIGGYA